MNFIEIAGSIILVSISTIFVVGVSSIIIAGVIKALQKDDDA